MVGEPQPRGDCLWGLALKACLRVTHFPATTPAQMQPCGQGQQLLGDEKESGVRRARAGAEVQGADHLGRAQGEGARGDPHCLPSPMQWWEGTVQYP